MPIATRGERNLIGNIPVIRMTTMRLTISSNDTSTHACNSDVYCSRKECLLALRSNVLYCSFDLSFYPNPFIYDIKNRILCIIVCMEDLSSGISDCGL